ncbi:MAG: hypothetical protein LBV44_05755 [Methylobacillus sp.]|jgi:hypothetical protein|nr:hypothetical protein [Methylobacillus sp.]
MAQPAVKMYTPSIRVTLHKLVRPTLQGKAVISERFTGTESTIDLTPFLADGYPVHTSKSVRDDAGSFSISLADKPHISGGGRSFESLYGLVRPMDMIEIRFSHDPHSPNDIPLIMRGFVSGITRSETMGMDGVPHRTVTVNGDDFGKLWRMMQIVFLPNYVVGQGLLGNLETFLDFNSGMPIGFTGGMLLMSITRKVLNPYLAGIMPENGANNLKEFKLDIQSHHGTAHQIALQNEQGNVYDMLRRHIDVGIWNELFVEDREDGVYIVYRPNPAKDIAGNLIYNAVYGEDKWLPDDREKALNPFRAPEIIDVYDTDLISLQLTCNDAGVANYFWVRAHRSEMVENQFSMELGLLEQDGDNNVDLRDYPNSSAHIHGIRIMYGNTEQGGDDMTSFHSGQTEDELNHNRVETMRWIGSRRKFMVEQNKDNVLFEQGMMRVRGDDKLKAGRYIRLHRGSFTAEYYLVAVEHEYLPFGGFFSTLHVERGTGFIERIKRGGGADSPYMAEMRRVA